MPLVLKPRLGGLRNGPGKSRNCSQDRSAPKPLVVSDISEVSLGNILSMSHLLEPKVRLQLVLLDPEVRSQVQLFDRPTIPKIPSGFSDVFVYGRSQGFSAKMAKMQNSKIELLSEKKRKPVGGQVSKKVRVYGRFWYYYCLLRPRLSVC